MRSELITKAIADAVFMMIAAIVTVVIYVVTRDIFLLLKIFGGWFFWTFIGFCFYAAVDDEEHRLRDWVFAAPYLFIYVILITFWPVPVGMFAYNKYKYSKME